MFQYPYGDSQQLNLDWLMEQWLETKASIDGSLQGEIDRVEAAITDLLTARDQAVAAKTAAESAATSASGYAGTASTAASTATAQAAAAAASAALAGNHASNAQTSETNAGLQSTAAGNSASSAATSATNARNSELAAAASSSAAAGNALYSEGWAVGTQNGVPVTAGSPYYENNAKYYAEHGGGGGGTIEIKTIENVSVAHIEDATPDDIKELDIEITPVQSGTGNPSPDNVRPISGWTECNVWDKTVYDTTLPATKTYPFPAAAGTVFGGSLIINEDGSGSMTVTLFEQIIDENTTINSHSVGIGNLASKFYCSADFARNNNGLSYCNYLVKKAATAITDENKYVFDGSTYVHINIQNTYTGIVDGTDDQVSALAKFRTYLALHPVQIVATLATPIEYTLTAQEVITLLEDENYVWTDTGNIAKLKYYAYANTDQKIALVKALIAPVEDDYVATQVYAANDFLIVDNTLYIVTASIANGATITPGTNVTATTVGTQLSTILNS